MVLRLYNTLTRTKEDFVPLDPSRVRIYVCGPTVYDFAHIGNARPVIVFDVLFRLLRHLFGQDAVTYVRNITDVDDKINARAAERGVPIRELTEETYRNFKEDVAALGCLPPTVEPRATEHINEMKTLIERLIASGNAYVAEEHVLFSVPSMPDYGRLSKRSLDEMVEGEKMSKSLGNFFTIREVLADWQGDVIRLAMLSTHYTQPINWTVKGLQDAEKALGNFFDAAAADAEPRPAPGVLEALADDLNTPKAISEMHALRSAAGRKALAGTLAFFGLRPTAFSECREPRTPAPSLPADEFDRPI